ncbi:calmin-like isoform X2 [Scyliorhinus canicula]|uniref:calmin-like isoform X2 n=1 Tax=Scyliorhinus canicula TaxID=7830 RepID=UPI0018F37337|nr:calmin-like isoform X2 [Scyliorhinus canicula]
MARFEWDWFQREELIGHISDIRVQNLQVERVSTQKRTFTRWINFHLDRCNPPLKVKDLFQDMQDGKILMALLEVLSGQRLMHQYKRSSHRIFRLNNIAKALQFLEEGYVKLVSIDAPEIADGNPSMILGLIWNIILHFQIKEATGHLKIFSPTSSLYSSHSESDNDLMTHCIAKVNTPSTPYKDQRKVIKVLLNWVQRRTAKYGITVQDFGTSWRSGIAFLALIKAINPSLVDMRKAMERPNRDNLEDAFKIAHVNLDIPPLLEPEDVDVERPEEQSITTYVSQFVEHFPDIDENNSAEVAYESPFEDSLTKSAAMSTEIDARDSNKMHIGHTYHTSNNGLPAQDKDDRSLVIQERDSVAREMVTTPFIGVSSTNSSNTSLHQDSQSTSLDLHNGSLKPASDADATDTVEEIYVLLRPLKRKSSTGEKILVLEKEPSSPVTYDHHSPVAANDVMKVGSRVEIPQSFAKDLCGDSLETSSEKENSSLCNTLHENPNSPQDQYLSLDCVYTQLSAGMPARSRNVSESCTQTDEKPSPEHNDLLPSVIDSALLDDEKVSVIPLNLVYYPHYKVPVSEVLEAFSVTGNSQKEFVPEFQHLKDLSPLVDEAYQSCSELSSSLSLQELSPSFSEKTLCTPDSDQICTLNNSNHPEVEVSQPFSSFQGIVQSQFMPVAMASAPKEHILVSLDKLPEQPILKAINEQLEDRPSVQKCGDLQMPERENEKNREENSADPKALGDQLWDLLPREMGPKEIGEDVGNYSGSELQTDTIDEQHTVLQSTAILSSTTFAAENLQGKSSYDVHNNHTDYNQEFLLKAVDGPCSSDSEQHASDQDNVELLVQPKVLVQCEHSPDPNISSLTGQEETPQKVPGSLLLLSEAKVTNETRLRTRLTPQSDNSSVLEAMWHPAAVVVRDKAPPRSSGHSQLPYLVILLWMVVYWLIILLHLDMESLGQFTSS